MRRFLRIFIPVAIVATAAAFFISPRQNSPFSPGVKADRILVEKNARRLTLFRHNYVLKTYCVALGSSPVGQKEREGDGRTPEGIYRIDFRKPNSAFHRALHISYPNTQAFTRAAAGGFSPGSDIMIHGLPKSLGAIKALHQVRDWTAGCIAVTNHEIDEIWDAVDDGTPVEIRP